MRNNSYLRFGMVFLIVVLAVQIVSAAEGPYGWEYEDGGEEVVEVDGIDTSSFAYIEVVEALNESEWIKVIIGVVSEEIREEIISLFNETEIRSISRWERGNKFSGEITKQGLDKLVNNTNVKWVNLGGKASISSNESTNDTTQENETEEEQEAKSYTLWIIIGIIIVLILVEIGVKKKR